MHVNCLSACIHLSKKEKRRKEKKRKGVSELALHFIFNMPLREKYSRGQCIFRLWKQYACMGTGPFLVPEELNNRTLEALPTNERISEAALGFLKQSLYAVMI